MFDTYWNAALQRLRSPAVDAFFQVVTDVGYGTALVLVLIILHWSWDKRKAFGLLQLVIWSGLLNHLLKEWFQMPRPFQVDPLHAEVLDKHIRGALVDPLLRPVWWIPARTTYGFPSGHSQMAVVFWGALALHARQRGATIAAVALIVLTALSRLYLGVHFLGDVLAGLAIGGLCLAAYALWIQFDSRTNWAARHSWSVLLVFAVPTALFLLKPDTSSAPRAFVLVGFAAGCVLENRWVRFSTRAGWIRIAIRTAIGLALLLSLRGYFYETVQWLGWDALLCYPIARTSLHYGLIGLTSAFLLPWLFARLRLMETDHPSATTQH
jgi:membrane-associated phospholipid phosphatase